MKHLTQKYRIIGIFFSSLVTTAYSNANIYIRSQSVDAARELVGWTDKINLNTRWLDYGAFAITPEYTQSFDARKIAKNLFGTAIISTETLGDSFFQDCGNSASFVVSGSLVAARGANDLLADYFGLPQDFQSVVTLKPRIENFIFDFDWYHGHSSRAHGLWFRIHAPLVYARWKLNLKETVLDAGVDGYAPGYFAPAAVPRSNLLPNFTAYLSGQAPTLNGGVTFQPLQNEVLSRCPSVSANRCADQEITCVKLSDVQFASGWNFFETDEYHAGLGLRVSAPTGTRISNKYIFQPQIGNGHHWEAGAMITSHWTFYRNADDTKAWGVYFDANVTHLFETRQCRVFDLCGRGNNSKYMLALKMGLPVLDGLVGNATNPATAGAFTAPTSVFQNQFVPVANIAQAQVKVSIPVQADIVALLNYRHCNFSWDIGYNFWSVSCEKIKPCGYSNNKLFFGNNTYALKGDAQVFGFTTAASSPSTCLAVPLSATESFATINAGGNQAPHLSVVANPYIDNPQFAYAQSAALVGPDICILGAGNGVYTSIQPVLLNENDIDYCSARSSGLSHKIFTHVSYTWDDYHYAPYFGIGGKAEFASNNNGATCAISPAVASAPSASTTATCSAQNCCGCRKTNISEWGIWLKGGISY